MNLSVKPVLRVVAIGASLLIALASGAAMAAEWPTLALFWFAPRTSGSVVDPIFGKPLNFFLFALPAWKLIAGWLLTLAVVTCLLAVLFFLISGGSRAFGEHRASYVAIALARAVAHFRFSVTRLCDARVSGSLRPAVRAPHDLRRHQLH